LKAKELKLENDKILGFDDFLSTYKESDPNAFVSEEKETKDDVGFKVNTGGEHEKDAKAEPSSLRDALKDAYKK
jgi:hypothetical protein